MRGSRSFEFLARRGLDKEEQGWRGGYMGRSQVGVPGVWVISRPG
jgi:hypothetical protein